MALFIFTFLIITGVSFCFPERGNFTFNASGINVFSKTMFNNTRISLDIDSLCVHSEGTYELEWVLANVGCYGAVYNETEIKTGCQDLNADCVCQKFPTPITIYYQSGKGTINCEHGGTYEPVPSAVNSPSPSVCPSPPDASTTESQAVSTATTTEKPSTTPTTTPTTTTTHKPGHRKREQAAGAPNAEKPAQAQASSTKIEEKPKVAQASSAKVDNKHKGEENITSVWRDGQFTFAFRLKKSSDKIPADKTVTITTRDSRGGFLAAADLPFLYFYLVMTVVYVLYGFVWLLLMACYWRDLLRIQYFMALVIILGLVEKVFRYIEFERVDAQGISTKSMVIFAELVSKAKLTVTLALVVIVAVGFGLVKPRLGPTLHKLLAVCLIFFILSSVEGCLRVMKTNQDLEPSQSDLIALIPLALCEVGILYWVFSSLLQTIKTLRLRRNVTKLSLYKHFTNLLIFCLLAAVGFSIWVVKQRFFSDCVTDIKEIWLNDGFWPILFTVMLLVIMILWRPSINSQRYSHSPLLENEEDGEDEEDTLMTNEAFETKKRPQVNGTTRKEQKKTREEKVEEDLKWIEDNIPSSVANTALQPVLHDSEEEIMTTRFELSKMD